MQTLYAEAESTLARAERQAWGEQDWDALARLYMPLQEARRQRRQRCGEGIVRLDLIAQGPDDDRLDAARIIDQIPQGQLLIAGWGSIEPALQLRNVARQRELFVETFLAAVYAIGTDMQTTGRAVVIIPYEEVQLPPARPMPIDALLALVPPHSIVLRDAELPAGPRRGTPQTFGEVMSLWERLHAPFLAAADAQPDPVLRMDGYRRTIRVDYASELAHQNLSDTARVLSRQQRSA